MGANQILEVLRGEIPRYKSPLRQLVGVVWANLKILTSYKSWLVMDLLSTVASVVMYYFVGLQVDPLKIASSGWGMSYLAFSLVGVATSNYLWSCLTRLSHSIQHEIRGGTLEAVAVSPVNITLFFLGLTTRGYIVSSIYLVGVFTVGIIGLKASFVVSLPSLSSFFLMLFLMLVANQSLGLIAAGIVMVYKRGDPVTFILAAMNEFLAGVLYPLELLEAFPALKAISMMFPYTHALDGMRRSLILGASLTDPKLLFDLVVLLVFTTIMAPLGIFVLRWGYRTIRIQGTTSSY